MFNNPLNENKDSPTLLAVPSLFPSSELLPELLPSSKPSMDFVAFNVATGAESSIPRHKIMDVLALEVFKLYSRDRQYAKKGKHRFFSHDEGILTVAK